MEEKTLTGYPSVDKPWLKYYSEEAINAPLPEGSMYEYMKSCNAKRLRFTALNYFGKTVSYQNMLERIDDCARSLLAHNVKPGEKVSLCMLTMPETVYLMYAINKIGAISNFLVLSGTEDSLRQQLIDAESKLLFAADVVADRVYTAASGTLVTEIVSVPLYNSMPFSISFVARIKNGKTKCDAISWSSFIVSSKNAELHEVNLEADDTAAIVYTGGTTGEPKGVEISNLAGNTIAFNYLSTKAQMDFTPGQKYLDIIPPFLAYGLFLGLHMPLCNGFEEILSPDASYETFPKLLLKYKPQHFAGGPLHIDHMMRDRGVQSTDMSSLVTSAIGGDSISAEWEQTASSFLVEHGAKFGLQKGYGMTEVAGAFCTTLHYVLGMIPFVKNNVRIINEDTMEECTYGQEGEICLSGPSLMKGYYKNKTATDEAIYTVDGVRWLRSGDLGCVTEDGYLVISGRIKRIFWTMGKDNLAYRIYPMAIEKVLCAEPAIDKCAVVGTPNGEKGFLPVAFIILHDEISESIEARLREICCRELPETSQPVEYRFVRSFPVTPIGKVDYHALEKLAAEAECRSQ